MMDDEEQNCLCHKTMSQPHVRSGTQRFPNPEALARKNARSSKTFLLAQALYEDLGGVSNANGGPSTP